MGNINTLLLQGIRLTIRLLGDNGPHAVRR